MAVAAENKNPKVGQAATKTWKSMSGGQLLSSTNKHGDCLRLRFM